MLQTIESDAAFGTDLYRNLAVSGGNVVLSHSSTVTVYGPWPAGVTGSYQPPAGAAKGYYLGVSGSTWTLLVTHPGTGKVPFTGKITYPRNAETPHASTKSR